MKNRLFSVLWLFLAMAFKLPAQQQVIPLWPGTAPGSENWAQQKVQYLNDQLAASGSVALYSAWKKAGKEAELHVYSRGGHGFGMQKKGLPFYRADSPLLPSGLLGAGEFVQHGREMSGVR